MASRSPFQPESPAPDVDLDMPHVPGEPVIVSHFEQVRAPRRSQHPQRPSPDPSQPHHPYLMFSQTSSGRFVVPANMTNESGQMSASIAAVPWLTPSMNHSTVDPNV